MQGLLPRALPDAGGSAGGDEHLPADVLTGAISLVWKQLPFCVLMRRMGLTRPVACLEGGLHACDDRHGKEMKGRRGGAASRLCSCVIT